MAPSKWSDQRSTLLTMQAEYLDLWHRIETFELDEPGADFSFTDRLARENRWTIAFAVRAVAEYKRFVFLVCAGGHSLTPSDAVDRVWHLHLIYTRSYWIDLCENTLRRPLHHGPTRGGKSEAAKFGAWYEQTLTSYRQFFGSDLPPDIWPPVELRFRAARFQWVDARRFWLIQKPLFIARP